jgi:hypothetical protein
MQKHKQHLYRIIYGHLARKTEGDPSGSAVSQMAMQETADGQQEPAPDQSMIWERPPPYLLDPPSYPGPSLPIAFRVK